MRLDKVRCRALGVGGSGMKFMVCLFCSYSVFLLGGGRGGGGIRNWRQVPEWQSVRLLPGSLVSILEEVYDGLVY